MNTIMVQTTASPRTRLQHSIAILVQLELQNAIAILDTACNCSIRNNYSTPLQYSLQHALAVLAPEVGCDEYDAQRRPHDTRRREAAVFDAHEGTALPHRHERRGLRRDDHRQRVCT